MLIAVFADIHANRQAFEACLARAKNDGAEKIYLLGDIVGYGADPDWCMQTAMELVGQGALALWKEVLARAPADAEWRPMVEDAVAALSPKDGPSTTQPR